MVDIACIGEAYGEQEERQRAPFVGPSGWHLTKMLDEAGLRRADCYLTNVFNLRPPANKIEALCGPKATAITGWPSLVKGKYVRAEFANELERLGTELVDVNPNLVVALGNTALWALSGKVAITKFRGSTLVSTHCASGFKVLPTYHPAAVLRQWDLRPVVIADLIKAKRESPFAEIRRPHREIWIEPTLEDLYDFKARHIDGCTRLAVDIETAGRQITCIGFAPSRGVALVLPLYGRGKAERSYWKDQQSERKAWEFVKLLMEDPRIPKVFQNGLYDIAFLWRAYGIATFGAEHDTMLLHHALQPESLKGLGFLGSIYADEDAWKQERKTSTIKRDE